MDDAITMLRGWFENINLLEATFIFLAFYILVRAIIKLYIPLKKFVNFVDTMQSLPTFMELTNRRFLVLFEHLDIDPTEADLDENGDYDGTQ